LKLICKSKKGQIRVISIDTSTPNPFPIYLDKLCKSSRPYQNNGLEMILRHYNSKNNEDDNDFNTKVLICGDKGCGKSYIARLLKKKVESDTNKKFHLYDDFDPSSIGSNISRLILQNATIKTNVIFLIDEISISYETAIEEKHINRHDTRLVHTQNKQTLNAMFDLIKDKMYVIALYTTEKSPKELYEHEEWRSFFRKGRVDFILHIEKNEEKDEINDDDENYKCTKVTHQQMKNIK